jgi:hypothetical protein
VLVFAVLRACRREALVFGDLADQVERVAVRGVRLTWESIAISQGIGRRR